MFRHGVPRARIEVLRKVPMFEGLPNKVLARIDSHVEEVNVPEGKRLTVEGTAAEEAFIVADGVAEVRIGQEVVGQTTVGELIGEIGVLNKVPRTATVTALTPMRLLVINPREVNWLFEDKKLNERVQENLSRHTGGRRD